MASNRKSQKITWSI